MTIGAEIAAQDVWRDESRIRNGAIWDDPDACRLMLSAKKSAHRTLVEEVRGLAKQMSERKLLDAGLQRRLLILSLLIAYLEERSVLLPDDFDRALPGATQFFQVLGNGPALVTLLEALEERFNGHVFRLKDSERAALTASEELASYARLIEGYEDSSGQLSLWRLYSFRDLPVELISNIYQLFVKDAASSIYTPPALVRLILEEALSWKRIDALMEGDGVILDPACGSGVFRVFPTMSRTEANYLSDFLPNRLGPDRASTLLKLPKYAIAMLREEGVLPVEEHAYVVHRYGPDQVDGRELNSLVERLRSAASMHQSLQDPVALHRVARSLGGGMKPWGKIFSDLLSGTAFKMSGTKTSTIDVERRYAETLRRLDLSALSAAASGACPQRDMVEILNLPLKHVGALPSTISVADGQYDLPQILQVARTRITLTEMSAIAEMNPVTLDAVLTAAGFRRTDDFGWMRSRSLSQFLSQIRGGSDRRPVTVRSARRSAESIRPRRRSSDPDRSQSDQRMRKVSNEGGAI